MYWGIPHDASEPVCLARARAERDLTRLNKLAAFLEGLDHPAGRVHLLQTERDRSATEEWWLDLLAQDFTTAHARADTADEYVVLTTPMPEAARSRGIDFDALKDRIDIADYISRFTMLRPTNGRLVGRCPLPDHEDSTPSFWVYPNTRSWYCFGCLRGGDVIHFARMHDGTTARDLAGDP
jgi:CHC2 zinc finger